MKNTFTSNNQLKFCAWLGSRIAGMCFYLMGCSLLAKPHGMKVVSGQAVATSDGALELVLQTGSKTILEWDGFSIGANERIRFQQLDAHSALLNRVTGKEQSALFGELLSNGRVYLINPNGVLIGPSGRIETAGFIASSLDILNQNFLEDLLHFFAGSKAGEVVNLGTILCPQGDVALLARAVKNEGTIHALEGRVSLLSGAEILLNLNEDHLFIRPFQVQEADEIAIENSGQIQALTIALQGGTSPYATAIRSSGEINATSLQKVGGKVFLVAEGICEVSGSITAKEEEKGGTIHLLGDKVHLLNGTHIDASGQSGGGTVLVGGDFQGKNPEIKNATHCWAGLESWIQADALEEGNGGKVILWGDEATFHYGNISVRGGERGGDGGFVEVSGKYLDFQGFADRRAPQGKAGELLLDPINITISSAATSANVVPGNTYTFSSCSPNSVIINTTTLATSLNAGPVTVSTTASGSSSCGTTGTITVSSPLSWSQPTTLTLVASNTITINAAISNNVGVGFNAMNFTANGVGATTNSGITLAAALTTIGGHISLSGTNASGGSTGHGVNFSTGVINSTNGDITILGRVTNTLASGASSGVILQSTNPITTNGGEITISGLSSSSGTNSCGVRFTGASWATGTLSPLIFTACVGGDGTSCHGVSITGTISIGGDLIAIDDIHGGPGTACRGWSMTSNVAAAGSIQITANTFSGSGLGCHGISITSGTLQTTGDGSISLQGRGGDSSLASHGINVSGTGAISTTAGVGAITLIGSGENGGPNVGVNMASTNSIASASGNIQITGNSLSSVAGAYGIYINGGIVTSVDGTLTLEGAGSSSAINGVQIDTSGSVTTTGTGAITITANSPSTTIGLGASTISSGAGSGANISFTNPVILSSGASSITSGGTNTASFSSTIDGAVTTPGSITISTGAAFTPPSSIGATNPVGGFATTGSGSLALGVNITASGSAGISLGLPTTLTASPTLTSTGGSVSIATLNATTSGVEDLTVAAGGNSTLFTGIVGGTTPLGDLSVTASSGISISNNLTTAAGTVTLTGPVTVATNPTIDTTNSGGSAGGATITFGSSLNGATALTLRAGTSGNTVFTGIVGAVAPPTNLVFTSANQIRIGNNIIVSGANPLQFPFPTLLTGDSTITSNNANLFFGSTLNGAVSLHLLGGSGGTVTLNAVGNSAPLLSFTASGNTIQLHGNIHTTGSTLLFESPVVLNTDTILTDDGTGITFLSSISGAAHDLTLSALNGQITANDTITVNSLTATIGNNGMFNGLITTDLNTTLTSSAGSLTVAAITSTNGAIALQPSSTEVANLLSPGDLMPQGILSIQGTLMAPNGTVSLSPAGRTQLLSVATITGDPSGGNLTIQSNALTVGDNETITVFGDVNWTITGASHFGDVIGSGEVTILSGSNEIFLHLPGLIYDSFGQLYTDANTNILATVAVPSITPSPTFTGLGASADIEQVSYTQSQFEALLIYSGYLLTFDPVTLPPSPPPPSPTSNPSALAQNINDLMVANAQLSYLLPLVGRPWQWQVLPRICRIHKKVRECPWQPFKFKTWLLESRVTE